MPIQKLKTVEFKLECYKIVKGKRVLILIVYKRFQRVTSIELVVSWVKFVKPPSASESILSMVLRA